MIYHLITKDKWKSAKLKNMYKPNSLIKEGYIHCSYENQLIKVADSFYRGQDNILILCIDDSRVKDILRSEDLFNLSEEYPHIYGELPIKYIDNVVELKVGPSGDFIMPNLKPIASLSVEQGEWT